MPDSSIQALQKYGCAPRAAATAAGWALAGLSGVSNKKIAKAQRAAKTR